MEKQRLTNQERLAKIPKSEKARLMFIINKRIAQEKTNNNSI